jgi:hypothetical protein
VTPERIVEILAAHLECDCGQWADDLDEQIEHQADALASRLWPVLGHPDEVDELPVGSVILCGDGPTALQSTPRTEGQAPGWIASGSVWVLTSDELPLPCRVLWQADDA